MPVDYQDALEAYEATDWPSEADWTEADFSEAKKRSAPAPQKYTPPPANKGYLSNATFQAAMDKVRADVAANRTAITNVGSRVDTLSKRTQAEVKKLRDQVKGDRDTTASTLQMLAILPLLSTGTPVKVNDTEGNPQTVQTAPSTMTEVLPLLMLGGLGGSSGSGSSANSGGMDSGMLLAVALMAGQGNKSGS